MTGVALAIAGAAGNLIRVPYFSLSPGPAYNVLEKVDVEGADTHPVRGKLLLTTALLSSSTLTVWQGVGVLLRPTVTAIPAEYLRLPDETDEEADATNVADMELSKVTAEVAAFRALGLSVSPKPGALVLSVVEGLPAARRLRPGDRIVAVDGTRLRSARAIQDAIGDRRPGDRVHLRVVRDGKTSEVVLRTVAARDDPRAPRIGVQLGRTYRLPHDVRIDSEDIGGPSAGLVFALAMYEQLEQTDLTKGRVVAVTGALTESGRVTPIGAVQEKARSLADHGATVFVVPKGDVEQARLAAPPSVMVIGVDSLYEAIVKLRALPAGR